jgi:hypothetical protein
VHAQNVLAEVPADQFLRWVPSEMDEADLRAFGLERGLHPQTIPVEVDDLHREYALARHAIRATLRRARAHWPRKLPGPRPDLLPYCDLIVGGGAALSHAPSPGAAAMLLLDSLQPTGITELALDRAHLLAALGAAAYANPLAATQVLETGALLSLGTAICVTGPAREGEVVCTAKLVDAAGQETTVSVKAGTVEVLPLSLSQSGRLTLKPRLGYDVGLGPGRTFTQDFPSGGTVGIVIDARGRPIAFPRDPAKRAELVQQWIWKLSGA